MARKLSSYDLITGANSLPKISTNSVHGTKRHLANPYNPAQNGVFEPKNCTLVESPCRMLYTAYLSHSYWVEAVHIACNLPNSSITSVLANVTPFNLWIGSKSDLGHLQVLGCAALFYIPNKKKRSLTPNLLSASLWVVENLLELKAIDCTIPAQSASLAQLSQKDVLLFVRATTFHN